MLFFIFINSVFSSTPPVYKTCPDCIAFDLATVDFVNQTQGEIVGNWTELIDKNCDKSDSKKEAKCDFILDTGFGNVIHNMLTEDPHQWCIDFTLCSR